VEALGDAVGGDFDAVGVLGLECAVLEGGVEEIDYGERQALVRVGGGLEVSVSGCEFGSGFPDAITILEYLTVVMVWLLSGRESEIVVIKKIRNQDSCEGREGSPT
jgi:hypothetical protein